MNPLGLFNQKSTSGEWEREKQISCSSLPLWRRRIFELANCTGNAVPTEREKGDGFHPDTRPPSLYIRWSAAGLCWAAGPVKITWLYRAKTHTQERERERGKESIYTHTSRCIGKKASIQSHLPRTDRQQSFSVYTTDPLLLLSTKRFPVFFLFPFFLLVVGWIFIASKEKSRPLLPPHIGSDRYRHIRHPSAL